MKTETSAIGAIAYKKCKEMLAPSAVVNAKQAQ